MKVGRLLALFFFLLVLFNLNFPFFFFAFVSVQRSRQVTHHGAIRVFLLCQYMVSAATYTGLGLHELLHRCKKVIGRIYLFSAELSQYRQRHRWRERIFIPGDRVPL